MRSLRRSGILTFRKEPARNAQENKIAMQIKPKGDGRLIAKTTGVEVTAGNNKSLPGNKSRSSWQCVMPKRHCLASDANTLPPAFMVVVAANDERTGENV